MKLKLFRSISVVFIVTALLLIAPTVCAASMDMPAPAQSSGSCQQGGATERCFTTTSGSLSHCVLIRALGEQVKPPRLVSYDNVCLSWCLADTSTAEPSQVQAETLQQAIIIIPISKSADHHCRNILNSEEPPL